MQQIINAVVTDKRSVPFNNAGTGTIVTFGNAIVGTGTKFTTEMQAGSYLVDLTHNECRRVYRVDSDTAAYLEIPFTNNQTSAAPEIITHIQAKVKEFRLKTSGACFLNGVAFTGEETFSRYGNDRSSRRDLLEPVIIDATGQTMTVYIINY